eukprot:8710319-Alexandrium_andersonii.AAC.1
MEPADGVAARSAVSCSSPRHGRRPAVPGGRRAAPRAGPAPQGHAGSLPGLLPCLHVPPRG